MTKKLAEELKEARLKKDITLQQLFVKTRIDIKFLEAIENGNFDVLPEVYLKAFVKSYASAVGLDETTIIKKFDAARAGRDFEEKHTPEPHPPVREEKRPEPKIEKPKIEKRKEYVSYDAASSENQEESSTSRGPRSSLVWITLSGVLLIVALILYLIFFRGSSNQIISEKPYDEYLEQDSQRFEDTTQHRDSTMDTTLGRTDTMNTQTAPQFQQTVVGSDSLSLIIKSSAQVWVKVEADNNARSYEFILPANNQRAVKAKRNFRLVVGNAGAIQLQLNNTPLNFTGKSGEVRIARVDSSGLVYSRISKPAGDTAK